MNKNRRPSSALPMTAINLRHFRQKIGWSQTQLAGHAKVDRGYISGIETGRRNPTVKVLARLAGALGIPTSALTSPTGKAHTVRSRNQRSSDFFVPFDPARYFRIISAFIDFEFIRAADLPAIEAAAGSEFCTVTRAEGLRILNAIWWQPIIPSLVAGVDVTPKGFEEWCRKVQHLSSQLLLTFGVVTDQVSAALLDVTYSHMGASHPIRLLGSFAKRISAELSEPPDYDNRNDRSHLGAIDALQVLKRSGMRGSGESGLSSVTDLPIVDICRALEYLRLLTIVAGTASGLRPHKQTFARRYTRRVFAMIASSWTAIYDKPLKIVDGDRQPGGPTICWAQALIRLAAARMPDIPLGDGPEQIPHDEGWFEPVQRSLHAIRGLSPATIGHRLREGQDLFEEIGPGLFDPS